MKKILIIAVTILMVSKNVKAQTDTLTVIQNIVNNKAQYIGQPFSVLLNQLPIQIKYYFPARPYFRSRNKEHATTFSFYFRQNPDELYKTYPRLLIYWQTYLTASMSLYNQTNGAWTSSVVSRYSQAIISDIMVIKRP
ncbi:MAG TPA: hypothetical protein PK987_03000 [Ferruginibacter sp.]|nr:hypothetical protein [Ferruginibacter sp.]